MLPIKLPSRSRHVAVSREMKNHVEVAKAFNRALAEVRKDGSYQAIIDKWDARYGGL